MLSLNCDPPCLCEFLILFATVKLKLGHNVSQFIHRSGLELVYTSKFLPIMKDRERWKIGIFE